MFFGFAATLSSLSSIRSSTSWLPELEPAAERVEEAAGDVAADAEEHEAAAHQDREHQVCGLDDAPAPAFQVEKHARSLAIRVLGAAAGSSSTLVGVHSPTGADPVRQEDADLVTG